MPATESKGGSLLFRDTLSELERLVDFRTNKSQDLAQWKLLGMVSSIRWSYSPTVT